jgi:4,4'-diaponeurosporenoate glycosyltransferase
LLSFSFDVLLEPEMSLPSIPIELLWLLLPWSLAFVFLGRMRRCPPLAAGGAQPKVSVIVPARNERLRLTPLLASLQRQDCERFEVIVVDDGSTDGTADLARDAGATTLTVDALAEGWLGKPHACWLGAQQATGDLLLFLDADTDLEPDGLRRIAATHARFGGLVSIQPYHRMERAYERLSSFFFLITMGSVRSFTLAGEAIEPNGCFGPCMAISREDYFRTGGHRLVRAEVIDDIALSKRLRQYGVATHNFIGRGTISFRMYPAGIWDLVDGWTKNFARGAMSTDPLSLLMIAAWVSGAVATLDAARGLPVHGWTNWAIAGWIAYLAYVGQIWWVLRKLGNFGVRSALAYPFTLAFFVGVFLRSLYLTLVRNSVQWKGRSIPVRTPSRAATRAP